MNFFGISEMELVVILLVALLVFGPERMLDMARRAGRFWSEAQRTIRYAIDTAMTDEEKKQQQTATTEDGETSPASEEAMPGPEDTVSRPSSPALKDGDGRATGGRRAPRRAKASPTANGHGVLPDEDRLASEDGPQRG